MKTLIKKIERKIVALQTLDDTPTFYRCDYDWPDGTDCLYAAKPIIMNTHHHNIGQHLYIISDTKPCKGDYVIYHSEGVADRNMNGIMAVANGEPMPSQWHVIIASTDPKLNTPSISPNIVSTFMAKQGNLREVHVQYMHDGLHTPKPEDIRVNQDNEIFANVIKTIWSREQVHSLPVHIHEGVFNVHVYVEDGTIHVKPLSS